jgi:hypothetical protein
VLDTLGVFLYTDLMNKQWYIKLRKLIHNPITRKKLIKELNKLRKERDDKKRLHSNSYNIK